MTPQHYGACDFCRASPATVWIVRTSGTPNDIRGACLDCASWRVRLPGSCAYTVVSLTPAWTPE